MREPKSDDDVVTKRYVDSNKYTIRTEINDCLVTAGDTMTGSITMTHNKITGLGEPKSSDDTAAKKYFDDSNIPMMNS